MLNDDNQKFIERRSSGIFKFLVLQVFIQTLSSVICVAMVQVITTICLTPLVISV